MSPIILLHFVGGLVWPEHKNYLSHYTVLQFRNQILLPSLTPSTGLYKCQLAELLIDKNSAEKKQQQTFVLLAQKRNGGRKKTAHWYYPQSLKAFCPSRFAFMQHEYLLWMHSFPGTSCITRHLIEVELLRGPWSVLPNWGHRIPRLHHQLLSLDPRVTLQPEELWKQAICQKNCVSCSQCCFLLLLGHVLHFESTWWVSIYNLGYFSHTTQWNEMSFFAFCLKLTSILCECL